MSLLDRVKDPELKGKLTKAVGVVAILVSLVGGYVTKSTYTEAVDQQSGQISSYLSALKAFNDWQISDYPVLNEWVNTNPLGTVAGNSEVKASGAGSVIAWILFFLLKSAGSKGVSQVEQKQMEKGTNGKS